MVTRYSHPRFVTILGHLHLAFGHSTADVMGYDTIVAYSTLTFSGFRRVWAF